MSSVYTNATNKNITPIWYFREFCSLLPINIKKMKDNHNDIKLISEKILSKFFIKKI